MTNGELLAQKYPDHVARIRELADDGYMDCQTTFDNDPQYALAGAFDWERTDEGWDFWHDLYERGAEQP